MVIPLHLLLQIPPLSSLFVPSHRTLNIFTKSLCDLEYRVVSHITKYSFDYESISKFLPKYFLRILWQLLWISASHKLEYAGIYSSYTVPLENTDKYKTRYKNTKLDFTITSVKNVSKFVYLKKYTLYHWFWNSLPICPRENKKLLFLPALVVFFYIAV